MGHLLTTDLHISVLYDFLLFRLEEDSEFLDKVLVMLLKECRELKIYVKFWNFIGVENIFSWFRFTGIINIPFKEKHGL